MATQSTLPERQIFRLNEHEIFYYSSGPADGPVYVLVPGIGVSHRYYVPLAAELAKLGRVYMLDMPGFGLTRKPKHSLSISEYAEILGRFLERENIVHPILVGHSMGCQIVTDFLARQPEISDRLVLLGPTVNPRERHGLVQALRLMQDGFHEPLKLNYIVTSDYLRCGLRWYFKVLPRMLEDRPEGRLGRLSARTIVVRGQHDKIVPRVWTQQVTKLIAGATMHEVPGVGHVCMYKYPKIVAALIRQLGAS